MGDLARAEEAAIGRVKLLSVVFASGATRLDEAVAIVVLGFATVGFLTRRLGPLALSVAE